jgi:hypothetical protein
VTVSGLIICFLFIYCGGTSQRAALQEKLAKSDPVKQVGFRFYGFRVWGLGFRV